MAGGSVLFSENEQEVKTYHCTQLRFPPCAGYLTVTNKRLIFHGFSAGFGNSIMEKVFNSSNVETGTNSRIVNEVKIDSISGLNTFYGAKINAGKFILGIALLILAIVLFATSSRVSWSTGRRSISGFQVILGIVALGLSIWQFSKTFRRTFFCKVYSSQATGAISIGEGMGGIIGGAATFSMSALPTAQTDLMIKELGAMILDIQALGDRGVKKWQPQPTSQTTV